MSKNAGYLVKTKTGKEGRTYHRDGLVNKKMVVYVEINNKEVKMLCDPKTIEITGFID
jgi:hypothetical protein